MSSANEGGHTVSLLTNNSTLGNISFTTNIDFSMGPYTWINSAPLGDLDGDGKTDFITVNSPQGTFNVFRNRIGEDFANAGRDSSLCFGDSVQIGTSAIFGYTYNWTSIPTGFTSILATPVVSPSVTTAYYLSVNSPSGLIAKDTVVISTISSLLINAGNDQSICSGSSTIIGSDPLTGNTYSWSSNPLGFTSDIANPVIYPLANTQYYLSIANIDGCHGKDTVVINVTNALSPSVTIEASNLNICSGANVIITATLTDAGNTPTYQWQVNNVNAGTNNNTFTTNTLTNGSTIKLIITSSASCASPVTATSNIITMNVGSVPSITVAASSTNICSGTTVIFTATPTNGGSSSVYQWKLNGNNVGIDSATYSSNTLVNGDVISVTLTSIEACASSATVSSNNITMTVNPITNIGIIKISGATEVIQGSSATISATIINGGSSPAYEWQDSTSTHSWQIINGVSGSTIKYTPLLTGDKLKCIVTSNINCAVAIVSNVLEFKVLVSGEGGKIHYYPNPVNNKLTIDSLHITDEWETLSILNNNGSPIINLQYISRQTKVVVNVEALLPGVYIAILRNKQGESTYFKFIKM